MPNSRKRWEYERKPKRVDDIAKDIQGRAKEAALNPGKVEPIANPAGYAETLWQDA